MEATARFALPGSTERPMTSRWFVADELQFADEPFTLSTAADSEDFTESIDERAASSGQPSVAQVKSQSGADRRFHSDGRLLKELEDAELLLAFQDGSEPAFYTLFERRQKEIFTHCFRMCSGDAEKANDAFQDTFVKVFLRKDLFTDATNGRAWLYRIATNTCLNQLRYDKRHPKEALEDATMSSIDPKLMPDFDSEQENLRTELERAIAKLPMELRQPFLLRELEEFSYEEVSEQLGLTVAACRQRVYRAKQMLREELEELVTGEASSKKAPKSQARKVEDGTTRITWNPFAKRQ